MPKKPKSGKITINLSPQEVKTILGNPAYKTHTIHSIASKLYEAVAKRFSDVQVDMAEETKAGNIRYDVQHSDEWKATLAKFAPRRKEIDEQYTQINQEEAKAMENLIQAAFDKAGITHFVATGYGFRRVVSNNI